MMSEKSLSILKSSVRTEPETVLGDDSLGNDFLFFETDGSCSSRDCSFGNSFLNIIPLEIRQDNATSVGSLGFQESFSSIKSGEKSQPTDVTLDKTRRRPRNSSTNRRRREESISSNGTKSSSKSRSPVRRSNGICGTKSISSDTDASRTTVRVRRRTGRSPSRPTERPGKAGLTRSATLTGQPTRSAEERIQRREAYRRTVSLRDAARKENLSPCRPVQANNVPQPAANDVREDLSVRSSSLSSHTSRPRSLSQPRRLPRCHIHMAQLSQSVHSNVVACVDEELKHPCEESQQQETCELKTPVDPTTTKKQLEGSSDHSEPVVRRNALGRVSVFSPFLKATKTTGKSAAKVCSKLRESLASNPTMHHKEKLGDDGDEDDSDTVASFA